jgi:hypothetical protein
LIITHSRLAIGLWVTCAIKGNRDGFQLCSGTGENVIAETISALDSSRNPRTPRIDCRDIEVR